MGFSAIRAASNRANDASIPHGPKKTEVGFEVLGRLDYWDSALEAKVTEVRLEGSRFGRNCLGFRV